jgi:hypothetical protein
MYASTGGGEGFCRRWRYDPNVQGPEAASLRPVHLTAIYARPKHCQSNYPNYHKNNINFRCMVIFYMFLYFSLTLSRLRASLLLNREAMYS